MQLGQGREKTLITSALGSPVVGKLTSPERTVTKALLNPECQTDSGLGLLSVCPLSSVPIFLWDVTSPSLLLNPLLQLWLKNAQGLKKAQGLEKEDINTAKPYDEGSRDPSSATRFLLDLEEEPLCSQLPQLPSRKNTTGLLPKGKAEFSRRR